MKIISHILLVFIFSSQGIGQDCDQWDNQIASYNDEPTLDTKRIRGLSLLLDEINDSICPSAASACFRGIADCLRDQGQYERAKANYSYALELSARVRDTLYWASAANNLGNMFQNLNQLDSAVFFYRLAKEKYSIGDSELGEVIALQNLAECYLEKGNKKQSRLFCDELLLKAKSIEDQEGIIGGKRILVELDLLEKSISDSTFYFLNDILVQCKENSLIGEEYVTFALIGKAHELTNNFDSSSFYYEKASKIPMEFASNDFLRENSKNLTRVNLLLKQRNRTRVKYLFTLAVLCMLLGILIFFILKNKKQSVLIANQKIDELLRQQEVQSIESMLIGQDRERKRIAEELHDRLGGMLATLKLHYSSVERQIGDLKTRVKDQYIQAGKIIDETAQEVRRISQDLYSAVLVKFGLIAALEELKNALFSLDKPKFEFFFNNMELRLESDQEIHIYRIIQEGIANILKHAKASEVTIQLSRFEDSVELTIEDNGIGFDSSKRKSTQGLGLKNMESRVEQLNGIFNIDSAFGKGSTLIISIPISHDTRSPGR